MALDKFKTADRAEIFRKLLARRPGGITEDEEEKLNRLVGVFDKNAKSEQEDQDRQAKSRRDNWVNSTFVICCCSLMGVFSIGLIFLIFRFFGALIDDPPEAITSFLHSVLTIFLTSMTTTLYFQTKNPKN